MSNIPPDINLSELLKNPVERKRILETLRANKPRHWSSRSNSPYYNIGTATEMKAVLDRMLESKIDEMYFFKDFPQFKRTTLYSRINQGMKFLCDHLDPDEKYTMFWNCIYCHTHKNVGIKLEIRHDLLQDVNERTAGNLPTQLIQRGSLEWKEKMEDFLMSGPINIPFNVNGLELTPEQVQDLEIRFAPLDHVIAKITNDSIKLIKTA